MNVRIIPGTICAAVLATAVNAQTWPEIGDAPDGVPANQSTTGAGALNSITGVLNRPAGDHVDTYCIVITDVAQFYATTKNIYGASATTQTGSNADTRLWLWDSAGNILLGNDDINALVGDTLASLVSDPSTFTAFSGGEAVNATAASVSLVAGQTYLLSISEFANDPDAAGGVDLVLFSPFDQLHGKNPAAGAFVAWENTADPSIITYDIRLAGAAFCTTIDPTGACCLGAAPCLQKTEDECDALGGSYQSDGSSCTEPGICDAPTGACCFRSGTCLDLTEADCAAQGAQGGMYQGDGTTCAQTACPQPGACCFKDGSCQDLLETDCNAAFGSFQGEQTTCATTACLQPDRVSDTEKGSVLVFPNVELRWSTLPGVAGGGPTLIQDTFIDIANDFPADVKVKLYFINGDPRFLTPAGAVFEPGWNWADNVIQLTANEPTYWSVATGQPKGVSPFTVLDPGAQPGRPDHKNPTERMLRGFIIAFAVNELGQEIRWNHLKGDAVVINYRDEAAWEYNAYSFRAVNPNVPNGQPTGTPGVLNLDGLEFARGFDQLLLDFYAIGSAALSGPNTLVTVNTDLTLHPVDADLRQETNGPITTKASFDIWNMNEVKFTGLDHCITCWDQTILSNYGLPNHFFLSNLQTDKGRARIDGLSSILCPPPGQGGIAGDAVSSAASLLGVKMTLAIFDGGARIAHAGSNLHGVGLQNARIKFDFETSPPAEAAAGEVKQPKPKRRPNRRQR